MANYYCKYCGIKHVALPNLTSGNLPAESRRKIPCSVRGWRKAAVQLPVLRNPPPVHCKPDRQNLFKEPEREIPFPGKIEGAKMKAKRIVCAAIAAGVLCMTGCDFLKEKVANLEEKVAYMKEEVVPLRFQITEKSNDAMTIAVVLYDCQSGKKIGTSPKIELDGNELHVDFQIIQLAEESYLFFPVGLYTERMALKDSKKVFDMYDDDGFPKIYNGLLEMEEKVSVDEKPLLKKQLTDYFTAVKEDRSASAEKQYGMAVHDIQSISGFKINFTYKVLCHPHTGGIEIVKE